MVTRRLFVADVATALGVALAGCANGPRRDTPADASRTSIETGSTGSPSDADGSGSVVSHGSTTYRDEWTVHLAAVVGYELALTMTHAFHASVTLQRASDDRVVVDFATPLDGTVRRRFTVPTTEDYRVTLTVQHEISTNGSASYAIRTL